MAVMSPTSQKIPGKAVPLAGFLAAAQHHIGVVAGILGIGWAGKVLHPGRKVAHVQIAPRCAAVLALQKFQRFAAGGRVKGTAQAKPAGLGQLGHGIQAGHPFQVHCLTGDSKISGIRQGHFQLAQVGTAQVQQPCGCIGHGGLALGYPLGEPLQGKLAPHGQLAGIAVQFRGYDQRGQAGGVRVVKHGSLHQHGAVGGGSAAHQLDLAYIGKGRGPLQAVGTVHHAHALPVLVYIQA